MDNVSHTNASDYIELVNLHNGVLMESKNVILNYILTSVKPPECSNYVLVTFEEWSSVYRALIMRKERMDMLETLNAVVAERMSYVDDYIRSYELDPECHKHIFPVYTPDPTYKALHLMELSGAFVFLFILLGFSVVILVAEIMFVRFVKIVDSEPVKPFAIQYFLIDETTEETQREKIYAKYLEILELIYEDT
jgi:hypothetical protein